MREDVRKAITTLAAFGQDSDIGANMRKIFYEEVSHSIFGNFDFLRIISMLV